jgi:hypothetical protein
MVGGSTLEVDVDKAPSEGEVLIFTLGGAFLVRGALRDIVAKLSADDWTDLELAETGDHVVIRSNHVVALRTGNKSRKGPIGFAPRG